MALFALAARKYPGVGLVAWAPAAIAVPAPTLLSLGAVLGGAGVALACAGWWPVPWARAALPLVAGVAVVLALLASPLALSVAGGDVAAGIQAAALMAGALVAYAALSRREPDAS